MRTNGNNAAEDIFLMQSAGEYNTDGRSADDISYRNSSSGLTADNVQDAIDEVNDKIPNISVSRTYNSGVQIASITVDSDTTNIYIPDNGGGSSDIYLNGLTDVTINNPTNNQILAFDIPPGENGKWVNKNLTSSLVSYDNTTVEAALGNINTSLSNKVDTSSLSTVATSGDYDDLVVKANADGVGYDNSDSGLIASNVQDAIDELAQGGGGGATSLDGLSDVTITSATDGQVLTYDNGVWINNTVPDASTKMDKINPTGTGSFSLNRRSNSTVGNNSFAEGSYTVASGEQSHSEGYQSEATGDWSHAEGYSTVASNYATHAEGASTVASGNRSHAEGESTVASNYAAHAEGNHTIAASAYQHVSGTFNIADSLSQYAEIVGNGNGIEGDPSERSNARTLDWQGNEILSGNLTIKYNGTSINVGASLDGIEGLLASI